VNPERSAREQFADVGRGVRLCYQSFGNPLDPTVLLVMGLGLSMLYWRDEFCDALVERGFHVVRFDNRDVGRSTMLTGDGVSAWQLITRRPRPVYTIEDMADDAAALIAAVDARGAHVVGVSLGSFIAQAVAIRHPARTRSLVSIMGRPGDRRTGKRALSTLLGSLRPAPARHDPIEDLVHTFHRNGSPGRTPADDEDVRATTRRSLERQTGDGSSRQLATAMGETDRTAGLSGVRVPTLVVHGALDKVIGPSGGRATAAAVPGAELLLVPGLAHDLPRWFWPELIDGIARTAGRTGPTISGSASDSQSSS
jgi:pimeloyl-ACP methyl ester carboxylesterase